MKTISCNVIRDILPLYIDQAVSADTEQLVKEHLQNCETCRDEAEQMKKSVVLTTDSEILSEEARILEKSICGLEKRMRARVMAFAAGFDLLLNIAMPFFVRWVNDAYIKTQSVPGNEDLKSVLCPELLDTQWDFAVISGYCLFFGISDIFYMIGVCREKTLKRSEPLIILSYALKAAALIAFVVTEIFM